MSPTGSQRPDRGRCGVVAVGSRIWRHDVAGEDREPGGDLAARLDVQRRRQRDRDVDAASDAEPGRLVATAEPDADHSRRDGVAGRAIGDRGRDHLPQGLRPDDQQPRPVQATPVNDCDPRCRTIRPEPGDDQSRSTSTSGLTRWRRPGSAVSADQPRCRATYTTCAASASKTFAERSS